jgi:predicted Zn finger-like uncharacterized protein
LSAARADCDNAGVVVQCPNCQSRFRVADEKVTDRGVRVRCTNCKNVFPVRKGGGESEAGSKRPSTGPVSSKPSSGDSGKRLDIEDLFGMDELTGEATGPLKPSTGPVGARPKTGPIYGSKPGTGPIPGSKPITGPIGGSKPSTGPIGSSKPGTGPIGGSKAGTGPVAGAKPGTGPIAGSKAGTGPIAGSKPSTGPVAGSKPSTGPVAAKPGTGPIRPRPGADDIDLDLDPAFEGPTPVQPVAQPDPFSDLPDLSAPQEPAAAGPRAGRDDKKREPQYVSIFKAPAELPPSTRRELISSALTGFVGAALAVVVMLVAAISDERSGGWLGYGASADLVATRVASGLYDTAAGKPVLFVRGRVENRGDKPRGAVRVVAELVSDSGVEAKVEGLAGLEPGPEDVYALATPADAEKLMRGLSSMEYERRLAPGGSLPFFAVFANAPQDLQRHKLHVRFEPVDGWARPRAAAAAH